MESMPPTLVVRKLCFQSLHTFAQLNKGIAMHAPSSSEGYAEVALQHVRAFLPAPDACLEGDDVVRLGPQGIVGREDHSLRIGAGEVGV